KSAQLETRHVDLMRLNEHDPHRLPANEALHGSPPAKLTPAPHRRYLSTPAPIESCGLNPRKASKSGHDISGLTKNGGSNQRVGTMIAPHLPQKRGDFANALRGTPASSIQYRVGERQWAVDGFSDCGPAVVPVPDAARQPVHVVLRRGRRLRGRYLRGRRRSL